MHVWLEYSAVHIIFNVKSENKKKKVWHPPCPQFSSISARLQHFPIILEMPGCIRLSVILPKTRPFAATAWAWSGVRGTET